MKHPWQMTALLVIFFCVAQVLGLFVVNQYLDEQGAWRELPTVGGVPMERPQTEGGQSVIYISIALVVGTILILIIMHFKRVLLWKLWFSLAVVLCLTVALGAFIPSTIALIVAIVVAYLKIFRPNLIVHNLSELLMYGGLAAIFVPILTISYAFVLMLILSVYDMYAVWKSKHMVAMAKFQTDKGIFAGLMVPYGKVSTTPSKSSSKGARTAVLGGGDIGFPLIVAGTVLASHGFFAGLLISAGAGLALTGLLIAAQKDKFYPALPFLTAGCALGFAVLEFAQRFLI